MNRVARMLFISNSNRGGIAISTLVRMKALRRLGIACEKLFLSPRDGGHVFCDFTTHVADTPERLLSVLQSRKYDVISVISSPEVLSWLAQASLPGVVLYEVRGRSGPAIRACSRFAGPYPSAVIAPSVYVARLVKEAMGRGQEYRPVWIVPHGVDTELFTLADAGVSETVTGLPSMTPGTPIVLWVGRLGAPKNWLELMEIARILINGGTRVDFWMLVDVEGSVAAQVDRFELVRRKSALETHVHLIPYIPNASMPLVYNKVRRSGGCVLSTSANEGLQRSLLEGMACGCTVVSSAVGGNVELVRDGQNGRLYPSGKPHEAARMLLEVLNDHVLRHKLAEDALRTVRRFHCARRHAEAFLEAANRLGAVRSWPDAVAPIPEQPLAWYQPDYALAWRDGEAIPVWFDCSGHGHHLEQRDPELQPVLRVDTAGSRQVIAFRSDFLRSRPFRRERQLRAAFVVWRLTESAPRLCCRVFDGGGRDCGLEWKATDPTGVQLTVPGRLGYRRAPANAFIITSCLFRDSQATLFENGRPRATARVNAGSLDGLTLGARWNGTRKLTGEIAEVIAYDRALTAAEHQQAVAYLTRRYGVTG